MPILPPRFSTWLHGLFQRLDHIGNKIGLVLDATADAHEIVKDTGCLALVLGNAAVGHGAGDFDQRLDTAQGFRKSEDFGRLAEALGGVVAAPDAKGQHAAAHAVAVLLACDGALRVRGQAGVVDGEDVGGALERGGDAGGVFGGLAGAEMQRLEAAVGEPAVKGRGDGANGVLQKRQALQEVGGVEGRGAHDDVGVAVDVLCHRVDDNVCAVVERVLHIGRHEGVVDHDHDAVLVRHARDFADVDELQRGVRRRLDPDELGLGPDELANVDFDARAEGDLDVVCERYLGEVAVRSSIHIRDRDNM